MHRSQLDAFFDELEKIAADVKDVAVGAGATGAGAAALSEAVPRITGRTVGYHGTTAERARKIRAEGLKPANVAGVSGVIDKGGFPKEWADKAYVTKRPSRAAQYAAQSAIMEAKAPGFVRTSIPEWKEGVPKLEQNPEFAGGYRAWRDRTLDRLRSQKVPPEIRRVQEALFKSNIVALPWANQAIGGREFAVSHVPTEYIKGSPNYQRLTLKELGQYIRARPGRFAAGLGLGAAGAAGLAYGGKRLIEGFRGNGS